MQRPLQVKKQKKKSYHTMEWNNKNANNMGKGKVT